MMRMERLPSWRSLVLLCACTFLRLGQCIPGLLEDEYEAALVGRIAQRFDQLADGADLSTMALGEPPSPARNESRRSLLRTGRGRPSTRAIIKHAAALAGRDAGLLPSNVSWVDKMQVGCPWSATVTADTYNIAFPDLNCVYQVMVYRLRPSKLVRISGRYPAVRYFSFQSYSLPAGQPLSSLIDYQIHPNQGRNPFRSRPFPGASATGDQGGTYQVHVSPTGREGLVNELAAMGDDLGTGGTKAQGDCNTKVCLALVILRLYTADPEENAFRHRLGASEEKSAARLWGYVPPPLVSVAFKPSDHATIHGGKLTFVIVPECDEGVKSLTQKVLDWKVPRLKGDWRPSAQDNEEDNFLVYTRDTAKGKALFANKDANYLFATALNNRTEEGLELVAHIRARLPKVAHGLAEPPFIGEPLTYDARYASFSTIALEGAAPVVDTLLDVSIEQRYHWKGRWDRHFSLSSGPSLDLLSRCPPSVFNPQTDLFLSSATRQGTTPAYQGFLYRQILSRWQIMGGGAAEGGDRSVAWAKHVCSSMGTGYCRRAEVFKQVMRSYYPRISYFYCGYNSTGGCSCVDTKGQAVPYHQAKRKEGKGKGGGGRRHKHKRGKGGKGGKGKRGHAHGGKRGGKHAHPQGHHHHGKFGTMHGTAPKMNDSMGGGALPNTAVAQGGNATVQPPTPLLNTTNTNTVSVNESTAAEPGPIEVQATSTPMPTTIPLAAVSSSTTAPDTTPAPLAVTATVNTTNASVPLPSQSSNVTNV